MFCCTLLYVHSSIAIILMGKRELIALLDLSSWCLVMVERLFLAVPRGCLRFMIVVFPDHTHLLCLWCILPIFFRQIGTTILFITSIKPIYTTRLHSFTSATQILIYFRCFLAFPVNKSFPVFLVSNSYTMGCPPVRGDNPRALASGLSYVQVDKHGITILCHLH